MLRVNRCFVGLIVLGLSFNLDTAHAESPELHTDDFNVPVVTDPVHDFSLDWTQLEHFYDSREGTFVWHDDRVLNRQGRRLFEWLSHADREGLSSNDYHVTHLKHLVDANLPDHLLLRELLLTDGYLRLARDLRNGHHDPKTIDPLWLLPNDLFDPLGALSLALRENHLDELLDNLSPQNDGYQKLKEALADYRDIWMEGGWATLEMGQTLRPGEVHEGVVGLRERLAYESDVPVEGIENPLLFDAVLVDTVKRFQRRFGLDEDGVVGPETLRALNVPVETRIAQILTNLERWRWLPHELEPQHIWVNTAGFDITLKAEEQVIFRKRTVNGREERQTPSFNSQVTHLVVNPTWTVPRSIAIKDLLPQQQRDDEFLQRKRIRVYRRNGKAWDEVDPLGIDWSLYHANNFPFLLRQDSGAGNSLGRVKFYMPNSHAIYLHDTPSVGLFERPVRAFSSGCVRVEHADELARLLLQESGVPQEDRFNQALDSGETMISPLSEPIPVYLTYFTSWVDGAGDVHFRPDIYQRNTNLMLAMDVGIGHVTAQRESAQEISSL
ncbi:MAG: L,D-transpeptidase family protein [Candidatus Thiodiazotropha sp. (ex Monitilora ramsayi)]|nr:L,D-transpeptidase family protein [Candidatus Thiodiazotropha sp. (ex Monitilora ramsayi)]